MTEQLIYVIIEFGVLAVSITAIWILLSRFNKSLDSKIEKVVAPMIDKSEERMRTMMDDKDESSNKDVLHSRKELSSNFDKYVVKQKEYNQHDVERLKVLEQSLIESYKKQIRNIYYRVRNDGFIKDEEMAYLQKIFPYYKAMGGNSDIEAKYDELNRLYSEVTQEKFRKAREKCDEEQDTLANDRLKRINANKEE